MSTVKRTNLCTSLIFMLGLMVGLVVGHPGVNFNNVLNQYHIIVIVVATTVFYLTQRIPRLLVKKSE